jgi:hypothetical protein
MDSDKAVSPPRGFSQITKQFFLGVCGGILLVGIPLSYVWILPTSLPLNHLQMLILGAGVLIPGICSALWGNKFIDRLIKILESAPPI